MIKLEGVRKRFKNGNIEVPVLRGLDLTIADGELVALMGASGSGKSTLLHILGGVDRVTEGNYFFDDIEVSKLSNSKVEDFRRKNAGFIFQQYALMEEYTVYENIALPLTIKGMPRKEIKKKVNEVMESLGLKELADKKPRKLSGGEQQRTAIARAIVSDKKLILADEPTGALDSENGENIMELLVKIHESSDKTIIVVTHDEKIAGYCDRIIRIKDGKICA
ncbi:putative ABC transport system ATP-binding protein [Eubacterium ruminantium]|nr:putative ABC transport system ATP-binding protein [Eubacterium ruminantium]